MTQGAKCVGLSTSVAVLVGLLAGCAGRDPDPQPIWTTAVVPPSASPSPEATADTMTLPVRPPEMDQDDEVGAAAAAQYFIALYNYVSRTGDLGEWSQVGTEDCVFCANVATDVSTVYGSGGRYLGTDLTVADVVVGPKHPLLGGYPVQMSFAISAGEELDSAGLPVRDLPAESGYLIADVVYAAPGWVLVEVSDYSEPEL